MLRLERDLGGGGVEVDLSLDEIIELFKVLLLLINEALRVHVEVEVLTRLGDKLALLSAVDAVQLVLEEPILRLELVDVALPVLFALIKSIVVLEHEHSVELILLLRDRYFHLNQKLEIFFLHLPVAV